MHGSMSSLSPGRERPTSMSASEMPPSASIRLSEGQPMASSDSQSVDSSDEDIGISHTQIPPSSCVRVWPGSLGGSAGAVA